jgi:RecA/RadA recombinase
MNENLLNSLEANFGIKSKDTIIKTNSDLDNLAYNGFMFPSVIEIAGKEASGKSMLALSILDKLQQHYLGSYLYIDSDYSFDAEWARTINTHTDKLLLLKSNNLLKIEELVDEIASRVSLRCIVVDSLANLDNANISYLISLCLKHRTMLIYTNQVRHQLFTRQLAPFYNKATQVNTHVRLFINKFHHKTNIFEIKKYSRPIFKQENITIQL